MSKFTSSVLTAGILTAMLLSSFGVAWGAENGAAPASPTAAAAGPSTSELEARIEDQQRQIEDLKLLVTRLEERLGNSPVTTASAAMPPSAPAPAPPAPAPAPTPAPAPPPVLAAAYRAPRELLPDIGHIGAQIGMLAGGATNPYKDNKGMSLGGYIDLPWKNFRGSKLSYEIMVGLQKATTTQTTTSGVNVLVNAVLNSYLGNTAANKTDATSYLAGPLPITSTTQEHSKVLTVAPVLLKYSITSLGRFRPYIVGGFSTYVWIGSNDNSASFNAVSALGSLASVPVGSSTLGATLNAILQGGQIGGLVPTAPELAARGVPHGQGNMLFGGQLGGGFEVRVAPKLSMGVDIRRNFVEGTNAGFTTFSFKQGLHW